jgi:4-alpha-glucanotransferase
MIDGGTRDALSRLWGITSEYHDIHGKLRRASDEAFAAVVRALAREPGADSAEDFRRLAAQRHAAVWARPLDPTGVVWVPRGGRIVARVPTTELGRSVPARLHMEGGDTRAFSLALDEDAVGETTSLDGEQLAAVSLALPGDLPWGFHELEVELPGAERALLIASPERAWQPEGRYWGLFAPLYALWSREGPGVGDFGSLRQLTAMVHEQGGALVGTTPMLAGSYDRPFLPSPYTPLSRLFWNELYLDERSLPGRDREPLRSLLADPTRADEARAQREAPLIDYRDVAAYRRRALDACAEILWQPGSSERDRLERFLEDQPLVDVYARFRARVEEEASGWAHWKEPARDGRLERVDVDPARWRAHVAAQWLCQQQLESIDSDTPGAGLGLYLDFPVGVHREGFDTWRWPRLFAAGPSLGAPPDALFSGGQNWGFPPLMPEGLREDRYDYMRACLRHHLKRAGVLRIDHVMAFHRLFWVPEGSPPTDGLYVRYPAEELYALVVLESHRYEALVLGEDLGTVPDEVRGAMRDHGLLRMHVAQFALNPEAERVMEPSPGDAVASLNTHDTPTFAGFWREIDLDAFAEIGCLDEEEVAEKRRQRARVRERLPAYLERRGRLDPAPGAAAGAGDAEASADLEAVVRGCHEELAAGEAKVLIANLEDLWLEDRPQNVPGTSFERPNWRRRLRRSVEEIVNDPELRDALARLDAKRGARDSGGSSSSG